VFYIPFDTLLYSIGTTTEEMNGNERSFRHTLTGCEATLTSGRKAHGASEKMNKMQF